MTAISDISLEYKRGEDRGCREGVEAPYTWYGPCRGAEYVRSGGAVLERRCKSTGFFEYFMWKLEMPAFVQAFPQ